MKLRRDVIVPNESDAFVFASAALRGRGLMPAEAAWNAAVSACELLPLFTESEDSACVRVRVGGALDPAEKAEWVGRVSGGLRLPDGRLALCGGAAYLIDAADWAAEYARVVEVPPGDYRVTVYCYLSAPNGHLCQEALGDEEPLGAWFRRTRPDEEMPAWLHNRCVNDPDLDPKNRARWKDAEEKRGGHVVDFLLHLEPTSAGDLTPIPVDDDGFALAGECRKPDPFPLGVPVDDLEGLEGEEDEEDDSGEMSPPEPSDAGARTGEFPAVPVDGGPVDVPLAKLARVARLAWMCQPYTQPALRLTKAGRLELDDVEGAIVDTQDGALRIRFADDGQPSGADVAMVALSKRLTGLPDGCVIEMDAARKGTPVGPRPFGRLRFRGAVAGGAWRIDATFPALDAATLREALALAEALEAARRLPLRDEAEAERVEQRVREHAGDLFGAEALQRTGAELALKKRDPQLFWHVATRAFWMRYAGVFPLQDLDRGSPTN